MMKYRLTRIIAMTVLLPFLAQNLALARIETLAPETALVDRESPEPWFRTQLPAELGVVTEWAPNASGEIQLVHLQDAHGNLAGQQNLIKICERLYSESGIRDFFLEGAVDILQPEYLQFYADQGKEKDFANALLEKAHLGGVEYFLLNHQSDQTDAGIHVYGLEEASVYREAFGLFQQVLADRALGEILKDRVRILLEKEESLVFSSDSFNWLRARRAYQEKGRDLDTYLSELFSFVNKTLDRDLTDPAQQEAYPALMRLHRLRLLKQKQDSSTVQKDKKAFMRKFFPNDELGGESETVLEDVEKSAQPRYRLEELLATADATIELGVDQFPAWRDHVALLAFQEEIDAKAVQFEMEALEAELEKRLADSFSKERLLQVGKEFVIWGRLLALSLLPDDLDLTDQDSSVETSFPILNELIATHVQSPTLKLYLDKTKTALRFYVLAGHRDPIFAEKIQLLMREKKIRNAAIITGGFHTEGLLRLLRAQGFSVASIRPQLGKDSGRASYEQAMQSSSDATKSTLMLASQMMPDKNQEALLGTDYLEGSRDPVLLGELAKRGQPDFIQSGRLSQKWQKQQASSLGSGVSHTETEVEIEGLKFRHFKPTGKKTKNRLLVLEPIAEESIKLIQKHRTLEIFVLHPESELIADDAIGIRPGLNNRLIPLIKSGHYDYVMAFVNEQFSEKFYQAANSEGRHLKALISFGTGTDNLKKEIAERYGTLVTNAPGPLTSAMAELGLALDLHGAPAIAPNHPEPMAQSMWAEMLSRIVRLEDMQAFTKEGRYRRTGVGAQATILHGELGFNQAAGIDTSLAITGLNTRIGQLLFLYAIAFEVGTIQVDADEWQQLPEGFMSHSFHPLFDLVQARAKERKVPLEIKIQRTSASELELADWVLDVSGRYSAASYDENPKFIHLPKHGADSKSLFGTVSGIQGLGRIGEAEAQRKIALGSSVLAFQRGHDREDYKNKGDYLGKLAQFFTGFYGRRISFTFTEDKREFFEKSHLVATFVPPTTEETKGWVNTDALEWFMEEGKRLHLLRNTGRGPIWGATLEDQTQIFQFAQEHPSLQLATDTLLFDNAGGDVDSLFGTMPNLVATGHTGSAVSEVRQAMQRVAIVDNLGRLLLGKKPLNPVNKPKTIKKGWLSGLSSRSGFLGLFPGRDDRGAKSLGAEGKGAEIRVGDLIRLKSGLQAIVTEILPRWDGHGLSQGADLTVYPLHLEKTLDSLQVTTPETITIEPRGTFWSLYQENLLPGQKFLRKNGSANEKVVLAGYIEGGLLFLTYEGDGLGEAFALSDNEVNSQLKGGVLKYLPSQRFHHAMIRQFTELFWTMIDDARSEFRQDQPGTLREKMQEYLQFAKETDLSAAKADQQLKELMSSTLSRVATEIRDIYGLTFDLPSVTLETLVSQSGGGSFILNEQKALEPFLNSLEIIETQEVASSLGSHPLEAELRPGDLVRFSGDKLGVITAIRKDPKGKTETKIGYYALGTLAEFAEAKTLPEQSADVSDILGKYELAQLAMGGANRLGSGLKIQWNLSGEKSFATILESPEDENLRILVFYDGPSAGDIIHVEIPNKKEWIESRLVSVLPSQSLYLSAFSSLFLSISQAGSKNQDDSRQEDEPLDYSGLGPLLRSAIRQSNLRPHHIILALDEMITAIQRDAEKLGLDASTLSRHPSIFHSPASSTPKVDLQALLSHVDTVMQFVDKLAEKEQASSLGTVHSETHGADRRIQNRRDPADAVMQFVDKLAEKEQASSLGTVHSETHGADRRIQNRRDPERAWQVGEWLYGIHDTRGLPDATVRRMQHKPSATFSDVSLQTFQNLLPASKALLKGFQDMTAVTHKQPSMRLIQIESDLTSSDLIAVLQGLSLSLSQTPDTLRLLAFEQTLTEIERTMLRESYPNVFIFEQIKTESEWLDNLSGQSRQWSHGENRQEAVRLASQRQKIGLGRSREFLNALQLDAQLLSDVESPVLQLAAKLLLPNDTEAISLQEDLTLRLLLDLSAFSNQTLRNQPPDFAIENFVITGNESQIELSLKPERRSAFLALAQELLSSHRAIQSAA